MFDLMPPVIYRWMAFQLLMAELVTPWLPCHAWGVVWAPPSRSVRGIPAFDVIERSGRFHMNRSRKRWEEANAVNIFTKTRPIGCVPLSPVVWGFTWATW